MIIAGLEFPDDCPTNCIYEDDFSNFGQNSICIRCPVFNCSGSFKLMEPEEYRVDWAIEWKKFFDTEERPELYF